MRVMVFRGTDKVFSLTRCCFCKNAAISDRVACSVGEQPKDDCECFGAASNIRDRMNELIKKLPEGYQQIAN